MATKFQSRIVGTIILAAVGVIFLPDILDGEKQHFQEDFAKIPIRPTVESEAVSFDVLEPINDDVELPESPIEFVVQEEVTPSAEDSNESAPDSQPVEVVINDVPEVNEYADSAWIIQLMSLKNEDNAKVVVADLQKAGYPATIIQENGFNRIIVGPDVSKEKLEKQIVELKKITGSEGRLLKFKPLNP
jgi:DedD protein